MKILMCPPLHFDIKYEINPWMHLENKVDRIKAQKLWQTVYEAYLKFGVSIELIKQVEGLPDMTFTANAGIVSGKKFISGNYRNRERKGEEKYFKQWFTDNGFTIHTLKHFQGGEGDALFFRGILHMGHGFRSDRESHDEVGKILSVSTKSLRLVDPSFYDFDTAFCPVGDRCLLYYPEAFDEEGRKYLEKIPDAFSMTKEEGEHFVGNSVLVREVLFTGFASEHIRGIMRKYNIEMKVFNLDEFKKSGGGIKCLILHLEH